MTLTYRLWAYYSSVGATPFAFRATQKEVCLYAERLPSFLMLGLLVDAGLKTTVGGTTLQSIMKDGSNDTPQPICECLVSFPLLWIKDYPGLS